MQIQSTLTHFPKYRPAPIGKELAQLDRDLAAGKGDSVDIDMNKYDAEEGKTSAMRDFKYTAIHHGVFGGVLGLALSNLNPLGAALGLGTGLYVAYDKTLRKSSGKVEVKLNGQKRTTRYYGNTRAYLKTPQEIRTEMLTKGSLGERIEAYTPEPSELPKKAGTAELASHKETLTKLAKERKLLASFGQQSRYGEEVLTLVDATLAARLINADRPVYAVGGETNDKTQSYEVTAKNSRSTVRREIDKSIVERTYNYNLHKLERDVNSLDELPEGEGLPAGFNGVYKDGEPCTMVVGSDAQDGFGAVSKTSSKSTYDSARTLRDSSLNMGATDKAKVHKVSSMNVRDLIMMVGIAGGMMAGMSLFPGVPEAALAGGVLAGVGGRELGWLAQSKMPGYRSDL